MDDINVFEGGLKDPTTAQLFNLINSEEDLLNFLWAENLISSEQSCPDCSEPMIKEKRVQSQDGGRWRCSDRSCSKTLSYRHFSFFSNSHLAFKNILTIIFYFYNGYQQKECCKELGVSENSATIVKWYSFLREVCAISVMRDQPLLGGSGKVVEIDEALFRKRKYNRGRLKGSAWVLGAVERGENGSSLSETKFFHVHDRSANTLQTPH